jgi:hypothetical protein
MQCKLCKREPVKASDLCLYHSEARDALKRAHAAWEEAYSGMPWRDYLNRVKALDETGQWIKDVITLEETGTA